MSTGNGAATQDRRTAGSAATEGAAATDSVISSSSRNGAYVPRWKRDANVKPEPYKAPSSGKLPQLGPGEYTGWQVGKKLGVGIHHSFLVFYEGYQNAPAGEAAVEAGGPSHSDANDLADGQPARKEVLRAISNYPGANPPSTEPNTHIIWTRHHVECIKRSIGEAYPLFQCRGQAVPRPQKEHRVFTYDGRYRIESAEIASKEEVLEFVKARDQSRSEKPASIWRDKLNSQWLKVLVRKCPEREQTGNPMEQ